MLLWSQLLILFRGLKVHVATARKLNPDQDRKLIQYIKLSPNIVMLLHKLVMHHCQKVIFYICSTWPEIHLCPWKASETAGDRYGLHRLWVMRYRFQVSWRLRFRNVTCKSLCSDFFIFSAGLCLSSNKGWSFHGWCVSIVDLQRLVN